METLNPTSNMYAIPIRTENETEFEVQAWLFSALRTRGVDVRGEIAWKNPKTGECCRFDLVVQKNGTPIEIIEVKAAQVIHKNGLEGARQAMKYRQFGVPVTFVYGMRDAVEYSERFEQVTL